MSSQMALWFWQVWVLAVSCTLWRIRPNFPKAGFKDGPSQIQTHTDQYHEVQERVMESDKHAGDGDITCK